MVPAQLITITDSRGQPVATVTQYYGNDLLHASTTVTTVTDSRGSVVTTLTQQIPTGASVVQTLTDAANGIPTATVTVFPVAPKLIPGSSPAKIIVAKSGSYFVVYFFPVILTALLLVPIQAIDAEIKIFSPFRLLTLTVTEGGGGGGGSSDALTMQTGGLAGRWNGLRLLLWKHGDPISLVGDLMIICAAGLVSLSGETVGLKLRGTCIRHNLNTCFVTIAVFPGPARAAQALLGTLMVLIVILGVMLSRWRTGTATHPTSVAAVCSLMQIPGTRGLVQGAQIGLEGHEEAKMGRKNRDRMHQKFRERLKQIKFRLGRVESGSGTRRAEDYGLIGVKEGSAEKPATGEVQARVAVRTLIDGSREAAQKMRFQVPVEERIEQALYLFFLYGLLTLILYYENTVFEDPAESAFEWFMDSQSFGVRMLFTSFGLMVSFMWDHLFSSRYLTYFPPLAPETSGVADQAYLPRLCEERYLPPHGAKTATRRSICSSTACHESIHRDVAFDPTARLPGRGNGSRWDSLQVSPTLAVKCPFRGGSDVDHARDLHLAGGRSPLHHDSCLARAFLAGQVAAHAGGGARFARVLCILRV